MAAAKKGGLGKGIDSLIPNKVSATKTEAKNENVKNDKVIEGVLVNINKVEPNREQPRKNFDEDALVGIVRVNQTVWCVTASACTGQKRIL